ncbi:MAG: hypothetical protein R3B13_11925 [Polyangiaceae bacterium]
MRRQLLWLVGLFLFVGCVIVDKSDGDSTDSPNLKESVAEFAAQSEAVQSAWVDAVRAASSDFTIDLTTSPGSSAGLKKFDEALARAHVAGQRRLAAAYGVLRAMKRLDSANTTTQAGVARQQIVATLVTAAGLVYGGYVFLREVAAAMNRRSDTLRPRIQQASPQELAVITSGLGIAPSASNAEALAAFDALDAGTRNAVRSKIEDQLDARVNDDGFADPDVPARTEAMTDASRMLGESAIKMTAGSLSTVAGSQGISEVLTASTVVGANTAAVVDLAVTVAGGQPLDWVGRAVTVTSVSRNTTVVSVDAPANATAEDAIVALDHGEDASGDAAAALVREALTEASGSPAGSSFVIDVPTNVRVQTVTMNETDTRADAFAVGLVDALLTGDFFSPFVTNYDTGSNPEVVIALGGNADGGSGGVAGSGGTAGSGGNGAVSGSGGSGGSGGGPATGYVLVNVTNFGAANGYYAVRHQNQLEPPPVLSGLPCGGTKPTPWQYTVVAGPFATAQEAAQALCPEINGYTLAPLAPPECVSALIGGNKWPDNAAGVDSIIQSECPKP